METTHIITVLVNNTSGVLLRISSLFARRNYNISSISASETEKPSIARMTIVTKGDKHALEQIYKQLMKIIDVREIKVVTPEIAVCREHLLIKMENRDDTRPIIINIANLFGAKIVDSTTTSIIFELTGEHQKLASFITMLKPYYLKQLVKTGITALERK